MLEKFKSTSIVTKILYLLAIVLFLVWVVPSMVNYYSTVSEYEKSRDEIQQVSKKYSIKEEAVPFTVDAFKERTERLFSKVTVTPLDMNKHSVSIQMKREDIAKFHTFIDTLTLTYLVEIEGDLKFESTDSLMEVKMVLVDL